MLRLKMAGDKLDFGCWRGFSALLGRSGGGGCRAVLITSIVERLGSRRGREAPSAFDGFIGARSYRSVGIVQLFPKTARVAVRLSKATSQFNDSASSTLITALDLTKWCSHLHPASKAALR